MYKYKYAVFDLDETLGYFTELGIFWDSLKMVLKKKLTQSHFNDLCDLFQDFFRPGIFSIISFLLKKKRFSNKVKLLIYTNNQAPKEWTYKIKDYIEKRMNSKIFDHIICAFKVHGKRIEMCRTTHSKTYKDLLRCTQAPKNSMFIFMDDQYHDKMRNEYVHYINVKPYSYQIPFIDMINRFIKSDLGKSLVEEKEKDIFKVKMLREMKRYNFKVRVKNENELLVDKAVTKKMMLHLQEFFASPKKHTRKNKHKNHRVSKKNRS